MSILATLAIKKALEKRNESQQQPQNIAKQVRPTPKVTRQKKDNTQLILILSVVLIIAFLVLKKK
jgi:hypothetical protein